MTLVPARVCGWVSPGAPGGVPTRGLGESQWEVLTPLGMTPRPSFGGKSVLPVRVPAPTTARWLVGTRGEPRPGVGVQERHLVLPQHWGLLPGSHS